MAPHIADAAKLAKRWTVQLATGVLLPFADLRRDFREWCEGAGIAEVYDAGLATWLSEAGFQRRRVGAGKVTMYTRR